MSKKVVQSESEYKKFKDIPEKRREALRTAFPDASNDEILEIVNEQAKKKSVKKEIIEELTRDNVLKLFSDDEEEPQFVTTSKPVKKLL